MGYTQLSLKLRESTKKIYGTYLMLKVTTSKVKHLDSQLNEQSNQNAIKVFKVFEPTNKKGFYKTLVTVINSPMSPQKKL